MSYLNNHIPCDQQSLDQWSDQCWTKTQPVTVTLIGLCFFFIVLRLIYCLYSFSEQSKNGHKWLEIKLLIRKCLEILKTWSSYKKRQMCCIWAFCCPCFLKMSFYFLMKLYSLLLYTWFILENNSFIRFIYILHMCNLYSVPSACLSSLVNVSEW